MKWFIRIWALLFCGIPVVFIVIGAYQIRSQHHKVTTWIPVDAVVNATSVKESISRDSDGHTSRTYRPIVNYTYTVNNQEYQCDVVTPMSMSVSRGWANDLISRFKKGTTVKAYHDPDNPGDAFLVRNISFFPYVFVLFPMLFIMIGSAVVSAFGSKSKMKPPRPADSGGFILQPKRSIKARRRKALLITMIWFGVGAVTAGHYFAVARSYETMSWIVTIVYSLIGLIPAGILVYCVRLSLTVQEPLVMTETDTFRLGDTFNVLIEQPIRTAVTVNNLDVALVCNATMRARHGGSTNYSTSLFYESRETVMNEQDVMAREPISGMKTFTIPDDGQASTDKGFPKYNWCIEVHADIADKPDYRGVFPITVLN